MKLYDFKHAPNPRRVRVFLAEKGIDVPLVEVDMMKREQLSDDYRAINPLCEVPSLVLDDGTVLTETTAICRYFEELHPEPPLMGRDPLEKAQIAMWDRRMEFQGMVAIAEAFRNSSPNFEGRAIQGPMNWDQIPALAERGKARVEVFFQNLDGWLEGKEFIAGDQYTIADVTGFIAVEFAKWIKMGITDDQKNAQRWYAAMKARPSAEA